MESWRGAAGVGILGATARQLREDLTLCPLLWGAPNLRFTNLDDANQYLRRAYRPGWSL